MFAVAASLVALTLSADARWSIVVTQARDVASPKAIVNSLAKGVAAQPRCAPGTYVQMTGWKAPPGSDLNLSKCNTSDCRKRLARSVGVERLVTVRLSQDMDTIFVKAFMIEFANGTFAETEFDSVELTESTLEADAKRMGEMLCKRLPQVEVRTPSKPPTLAASPKALAGVTQPEPVAVSVNANRDARAGSVQRGRFGSLPLISAVVAGSALVATGVFAGMGMYQSAKVQGSAFPTVADREKAVSSGYAMNTGAYVSGGAAVVAAGIGATLWLLDKPGPRVSIGVTRDAGPYVVFLGEY